MRSTLYIGTTLLLAALGSGRAVAQMCSGEATFTGSSARLFASAALGSSSIFHAGLALGGSVLFGSVEVGMTTYVRDETLDYRGVLGAQLSGHDSTTQLCPYVDLRLRSGTDVAGSGTDYKERLVGLGFDAGYVALRKGNTRIVPTASFALLSGRIKYSDSNGARQTRDADAFGLLAIGAGFGVNSQITISPSVVVPIGLTGETAWYGLTFSIRLSNEP